MPAAPQGITIEPNGQSVVVTITEQGGGTPTVYSNRHGTATVSMPATVTTRTTLFLADPTSYTVSCKVGGVENANGAGGTATVDLTGGGIASIGVGVPNPNGTYVSVGTTSVDVQGKYAGDLSAAIAAEGAGKRYLVSAPVTTITAPLPLGTGTIIEGVGTGICVITQANGANLDALVKSVGFDGLTGGGTAGGVFHTGLRRITLDGNKANNTGTVGIKHYGALSDWQELTVRNCPGDGIYSEWSATAVVTDGVCGHISNFAVHDNGGNGITWAGPHDSSWRGGEVFKNDAKGIYVKVGSGILVASDVHSWGANQTYAWYLEAPTHLLNCEGEGAFQAQLFVGTSDCVVVGGHYFAAGAGTPRGIMMGDGTHTGVASCLIHTKVSNCTTSAIDWTGAGAANDVNLVVYQTSGTVYAGTLPTTGRVQLAVNGVTLPTVTTLLAGNVQIPGHIRSAQYGGVPTIAAGAAAGTSPTVSVSGNDIAGTITVTTGTATTTGALAGLTYKVAYPSVPTMLLTPTNSAAGGVALPYVTTTAAISTLNVATALAASTTYTWNYHVLG